ncbi:hypothetical protein [Thiobacillus sp. 65-1402]|uniref:hypothetical protein n=1 Tax=Thiobacillus sp. 65-1402 TaxID=1895861 RepID=UPI0025EEA096|nr:hypothetical protein [Thiobacillus sp. 65-1402]
MSVILTSGNAGLKPVYPKMPGSGPAQAKVSGFFTLPPDGLPERANLSQILYMFLSPKEIGHKQKIVLIGQI